VGLLVRRVGGQERPGGAVEEPIEVVDAAGVAAQQAVVAHQPEVVRLRGRLIG
jgi:hypothetical protein